MVTYKTASHFNAQSINNIGIARNLSLGGALLKPEGPKFEAFKAEGSNEPPHHQLGGWGALYAPPVGPRPQTAFWMHSESPENNVV